MSGTLELTMSSKATEALAIEAAAKAEREAIETQARAEAELAAKTAAKLRSELAAKEKAEAAAKAQALAEEERRRKAEHAAATASDKAKLMVLADEIRALIVPTLKDNGVRRLVFGEVERLAVFVESQSSKL